MTPLLNKLRRGLRMPPRLLARRLMSEAQRSLDRVLVPARAQRMTLDELLAATEAGSLAELWRRVTAGPFVTAADVDDAGHRRQCPGERELILAAAERAVRRQVDLLGSGPIQLPNPIDWQRDYKTGHAWPRQYSHDIDYNNPDRPSDVKVPWEISRVQWLIPAAQAWRLTGDERYAQATREVLESWIDGNPCLVGVNWSCTMEIALRVLSWSCLVHLLHDSSAWSDETFRAKLLTSFYWHGALTERYLELADVNGNHCTADAAGMVFAGLLFGAGRDPRRWAERGWELLCAELPRQVTADGVDFEASVPYHRLVLELFFLPALLRQRRGLPVPEDYRRRVVAMARFTQAYTRSDGSVPLWGDADDARAMPLGTQAVNDHRYLPALVGAAWNVPELTAPFTGPTGEVYWLLGSEASGALPTVPAAPSGSAGFRDGGFFVMRSGSDHVFIDCGPVGLAGRGGHGHNDCLAFEAVLRGAPLAVDCGAFVYTASYRERSLFRSTAYHNTPQIAGQEINRFISPNHLWTVHYDARPQLRRWQTSPDRDVFVGSHSGYERLAAGLRPLRTIVLDHARHALLVRDRIEGECPTPFELSVPLHLAEGARAESIGERLWRIVSAGQQFQLAWRGTGDWTLAIAPARVSPSYGVLRSTTRLLWRQDAATSGAELLVAIHPADGEALDPLHWADATLAEVDR